MAWSFAQCELIPQMVISLADRFETGKWRASAVTHGPQPWAPQAACQSSRRTGGLLGGLEREWEDWRCHEGVSDLQPVPLHVFQNLDTS